MPELYGLGGGGIFCEQILFHRKSKFRRVFTLKNQTATKPVFNVGPSSAGHHRAFKWRFAGGPMMARLKWYLDPLYSHHLKKRGRKKNVDKFGPPLTKLSGSANVSG